MAKILNPASSAVRTVSGHNSSDVSGAIASGGGPAWDEEIVPTLRKRLEAESQYLSNRLSGSSTRANHPFDNVTASPHHFTTGINQPTYSPVHDPDEGNPGRPTALPPPARSRTKSTPLASSAPAGSSRLPIPANGHTKSPSPTSQTRIPVSRSRAGSSANGSSSSRQPSPSNPGVSPPKSSSIPIPVGRTRSRTHQSSIDSIDLRVIEDQGRIQDEPPPFLLSQPSRDFDEERSIGRWELDTREALDIAQKGHASGSRRRRQSLEGRESPRQRADTLKMDANPRHLERPLPPRTNSSVSAASSSSASGLPRANVDAGSRIPRASVGGMPRSSTSGNLGLGQPSTPVHRESTGRAASSGSKLRSKVPSTSTSSTNHSAFTQSQRSASLNMLAATGTPPSARLGIAAHFKPPESGFTPPRGTAWDDVVLPAVAKKMGTPNGTSRSPTTTVGDEESFVVEWDRDGTPLKWQKGKKVRDKDGNISITPSAPVTFDYDPSLPRPSPSSSAFSPTFEMSPDNPFPSTPTRMNPAKANDGLELEAITTTARYGDVAAPPDSPAPFSSYTSRSEPLTESSTQNMSPKRPSKKPSFLNSVPSVEDLRRPRTGRSDSSQARLKAPTIAVEPATPDQSHFPKHSTFPPPAPTHTNVPRPRTMKGNDGIKKGKCCTIM